MTPQQRARAVLAVIFTMQGQMNPADLEVMLSVNFAACERDAALRQFEIKAAELAHLRASLYGG